MHSYLIVWVDDSEIEKETSIICNNLKAKAINFEAESISDVKELKKIAGLSQNRNLVITLKNIQNSSEEALNSLLKLIEDPGNNIYFVLSTNNLKSILPTIISRCQVISLSHKTSLTDSKLGKSFIKMDSNARLALIDKIKNADDAKVFTSQMLTSLKGLLIENPNSEIINKTILAALKLNKSLYQNGNHTL